MSAVATLLRKSDRVIVTIMTAIKIAQAGTGERDALIVMRGRLHGLPLVASAFDFAFMGGSMGQAVGEAFIQGVEAAIALRPVDALTVTGSYSYIDARDRSPGSAFFGNRLARRAATRTAATAPPSRIAPSPAATTAEPPSTPVYAPRPAASFLDRIEAVIRSSDSTVAVMSRTA